MSLSISQQNLNALPKGAIQRLCFRNTHGDYDGRKLRKGGHGTNFHQLRERVGGKPPALVADPGAAAIQAHASHLVRGGSAPPKHADKPSAMFGSSYVWDYKDQSSDAQKEERMLASTCRPPQLRRKPDAGKLGDSTSLYNEDYGKRRGTAPQVTESFAPELVVDDLMTSLLGMRGKSQASSHARKQHAPPPPGEWVGDPWLPQNTLGAVPSSGDFMNSRYRLEFCPSMEASRKEPRARPKRCKSSPELADPRSAFRQRMMSSQYSQTIGAK